MKTFVNTVITKEELLKELKWHQEQDNFVKGTYFDQGKGCAVGCSIESINRTKGLSYKTDDHSKYPEIMGVPEWLARVEDAIFEGLSIKRSKVWPLEFTQAINVGLELDKIKPAFLIFVLESNLERLQDDKLKEQRKVVEDVIKLWKREDLCFRDWVSAAESAAWSAAWSAASAARSAEFAARSAAWSAESAASAEYEKFADKLLELMERLR